MRFIYNKQNIEKRPSEPLSAQDFKSGYWDRLKETKRKIMTAKHWPHELVVLGQPLRSAGGAGLNLQHRERESSFHQKEWLRKVLKAVKCWIMNMALRHIRLNYNKCKACAHLSSAESNHQVGDEGVLCLSWAMADHHTPTIRLSQFTPERQKEG